MKVSVLEQIYSWAILTALQKIPRSEIHENISCKIEGLMYTEKHLTWWLELCNSAVCSECTVPKWETIKALMVLLIHIKLL